MEEIIAFVKNELKTDFSGHDYLHALRVVNNAKKILKQTEGDELIIITACYLHDTVDEKLFRDVFSQIKKIKALLTSVNYTSKQISEIIEIITTMSFHLGIKPKSINASIAQDADRLDALGAMGIIRTIQYGQSRKRPFYEDINLKKENGKYAFNEISATPLSHFYEKLLKLPSLMNTLVARELAIKRVNTINLFLEAFYQEISDDEV